MAAMKLVLYLCFIGLTAGYRISIPDINIPSWDNIPTFLPVAGSCPSPDVQDSFDINQYTGVWYRLETINPGPLQYGLKCTTANYTLMPSGALDVADSSIIVGTTLTRTTEGTATADASEPAKMTVTTGSGYLAQSTAYWVLSTDYITYSLVYTCKQTSVFGRDLFYIDGAHILTRQRGSLDDSIVTTLRTILKDEGITGATRRIDQTGCNVSSSFWRFGRNIFNN